MDLELSGKVALVTGASYGIGAAIAAVLAAEGAHVLGVSRSAPESLPQRVAHTAVDLSTATGGTDAVEACLDRYGRLDVLVNNVGSGRLGTGFLTHDDADWDRHWNLNFLSAVRTTRAAVPALLATTGVIANVSSINAVLPEVGIYPYSALKAALDNLTTALSKELAPQGVRVVGVAPGPTETPLWLGPDGVAAQASALGAGDPAEIVAATRAGIPLGRFSTAEEIAALTAFLVSPRAGSITGTTVRADGGVVPTV